MPPSLPIIIVITQALAESHPNVLYVAITLLLPSLIALLLSIKNTAKGLKGPSFSALRAFKIALLSAILLSLIFGSLLAILCLTSLHIAFKDLYQDRYYTIPLLISAIIVQFLMISIFTGISYFPFLVKTRDSKFNRLGLIYIVVIPSIIIIIASIFSGLF